MELSAKVCPPNHYCSDDGLDYHICPHGTYPYHGGCTACPADKFCMTSYNRQADVTAGSVSASGDSFPRFEPQGWTYSSSGGFSQQKDHRATTSALGRISAADGSLYAACPDGYSCTHTMYQRCPSSHMGIVQTGEEIGVLSENQAVLHNVITTAFTTMSKIADTDITQDSDTQCLPCNEGYSCSLYTGVTACTAGYYSPSAETECLICPPGYYCGAKAFEPVACGVNTFNNQAGSTTSAACTACPSGFYSGGAMSYCEPCPAGYECSTGIPTLCLTGTYSTEGMSTCSACQSGYACPKGSSSPTPSGSLCPKGSYCETVSSATKQTKCPAGKYGIAEGATSSADCIACPPGYVCRVGTDDFQKYPCPTGHYCPASTVKPTQCPAGTYNPKTNAMSSAFCITCPAGFFCPIETTTPTICPAGSYCPSGTAAGTDNLCPAGTYSGTKKGSRLLSDCLPCTIGHYCDEGATTPTPAAEGYYIPYMSAASINAAKKCPPGYPCSGTGNYDYKGFACDKGYYCPPGTTTSNSNPCPAGTYSDRTDLWDASQCTVCPAGYYCVAASQFATKVICPQGYYCPVGTKNSTHYPCPTGTYGTTTGLIADTGCTNCTAGGSCGSGSSTTTTCDPGYYCPAGTTTSTPVEYRAPAGSYIAASGAASEYDNTPCGYGHYCPIGSITYTNCTIGTYGDELRLSACKTCPAGYYCDVEELQNPKP